MALSYNFYSNILKDCGKNERYSDALDVIVVVLEGTYAELHGFALGLIFMHLQKVETRR